MANKIKYKSVKSYKNIKAYKGLQIELEKKLLELADVMRVRIQTNVRDVLTETYKQNIEDTYAPTGDRGKAIQSYNETHTHQKAANYHHTGLFKKSVHPYINGNKVGVKIDDLKYDDGTSTIQVYKWLTRGTRKKPKYPYYPVEGSDSKDTPWAKYVPTPKHPFNELTAMDMNNYLRKVKVDLANDESVLHKQLVATYKKKQRKQKDTI